MTDETLKDRLVSLRDSAYVSYIEACRVTECLGADTKIERCEFGASELKAHCRAAEWLGKHRAYARAVEMLKARLE